MNVKILINLQMCFVSTDLYDVVGAGCSSVDSVPAFEAVGRRIDPSQWTQLQFGLFSVPTSGPQLVYQRPWYVLWYGKVHIKDPLLLIEKSSLFGGSGFPSKKCVNVTI